MSLKKLRSNSYIILEMVVENLGQFLSYDFKGIKSLETIMLNGASKY